MKTIKSWWANLKARIGDCYRAEFKAAMHAQRESQVRVTDEFDKTVIMMRGYNAPKKKK